MNRTEFEYGSMFQHMYETRAQKMMERAGVDLSLLEQYENNLQQVETDLQHLRMYSNAVDVVGRIAERRSGESVASVGARA